jgi:hypothetical protein
MTSASRPGQLASWARRQLDCQCATTSNRTPQTVRSSPWPAGRPAVGQRGRGLVHSCGRDGRRGGDQHCRLEYGNAEPPPARSAGSGQPAVAAAGTRTASYSKIARAGIASSAGDGHGLLVDLEPLLPPASGPDRRRAHRGSPADARSQPPPGVWSRSWPPPAWHDRCGVGRQITR